MNDITIDYLSDNIPHDLIGVRNVRYNINLIFKIKHVVLVEVYTGNVYKYHAVNYLTKKRKYLFFTKQAIDENKHKDVAERMMGFMDLFEVPDCGAYSENTATDQNRIETIQSDEESAVDKLSSDYFERTHESDQQVLLGRVFREILPNYGFAIRENQIEIAEAILNALQECKISLCEAEVGTVLCRHYT